jgi:hypothetical protein
MVIFRDQNAGWSHHTKFDNSFLWKTGRVPTIEDILNKSKLYSWRN